MGLTRRVLICARGRGSPKMLPDMNPPPNLAGPLRLGYIIAGSVLVIWGIFYAAPGLTRDVLVIIGAAVLVEGLIGFCVVRAMLGLGGKKESLQP